MTMAIERPKPTRPRRIVTAWLGLASRWRCTAAWITLCVLGEIGYLLVKGGRL